MKIEQVELRHIEMELVEPFETSFGREVLRPAIIISVKADGLTGWGECVAGAGPWYSYETIQTAWHVLNDFLIPYLWEGPFTKIDEVIQRWSRVRGHSMAKAGLEAALWDLLAQASKKPLAKMLGGTKERVASGVSIGIHENIPALLKTIHKRVDEGYCRVKLKVKPGWDENILGPVRKEFQKILLMADANAAFNLSHKALLKNLDQFNLIMIEQPFSYDDLVDHAELQREIKTPICLDESIKSSRDARQAQQLKSCRIINIKQGRVGGPSEAKKIHDFCLENKIPVWCGGMLETGIGRAHNVALASLPGFTLPNDLSASNRYYKEDIIEPSFELNSDGTLSVPTGPGIGVHVLQDRLKRFTREQKVFHA
ncbi:o-succinylbenzoate synthase [Candidatus Acetothermia bacterium]|nr:o-succinylbenzoate synthase [Candidatus Acetothermia bacterium]MBI3643530.1 o-succinylbenzoate synthase [Candidatus Acetothermia bacterium]